MAFAFVLLVISLLHIMNSMQYLVAARKHEFGILRAMGITDSGFRIMLLKEGLRYGVYSSIVMIALYLAVQKVLYYFMTHVFLYLHPKSGIQIVPVLIMILGEPGNLCSGSGDFRTVCAERTGGRCDTGVDRRKTHDTCL